MFRDFPRFSDIFRIFLGSSGTYQGVQNRSLGATFPKFWKISKWSRKCLGGSRRPPGVPRTPKQNMKFSRTFFLIVSTHLFLNRLSRLLFEWIPYWPWCGLQVPCYSEWNWQLAFSYGAVTPSVKTECALETHAARSHAAPGLVPGPWVPRPYLVI